MLKQIIHVGLTVKSLEKSIEFYQSILGLKLVGRLHMSGKETEALFNKKGISANIAYLNGGSDNDAQVELIELSGVAIEASKASLLKTSISELCFKVNDIEAFYEMLIENKVECLSAPQSFDFTESGMGLSKAIYFKDPDGIILEAIEIIK